MNTSVEWIKKNSKAWCQKKLNSEVDCYGRVLTTGIKHLRYMTHTLCLITHVYIQEDLWPKIENTGSPLC
jgi:hypothetical protein